MSKRTYIQKIMAQTDPVADGVSKEQALAHLNGLSISQLKLTLKDVIEYEPPTPGPAVQTQQASA